MKSAIKWILGIGCVGTGFLALNQTMIGGMIYILVGLFLIPPFLVKVEAGLKVVLARPLKYLIVFLGLIVGAQLILEPNKPSQKTAEAEITDLAWIAKQGEKLFDADGNEVTPDIVYAIDEQEVYDAPIKTQITRHIYIVSGICGPEDAERILNSNYSEAQQLRGFDYHNPATHYQLILYPNSEMARKKSGNWLGILNRNGANGPVHIQINPAL